MAYREARRMAGRFRRRLGRSRERLGYAARHDAAAIVATTRWLRSSREYTNFTYDLAPLNLEHLAWFVTAVTGESKGKVDEYLAEIRDNQELRTVLQAAVEANRDRAGIDAEIRYARRVGWYAIVRAMRPELVVETGVEKGLGSMVIAAALARNSRGKVISIDIDPGAGCLISEPFSNVIDLRIADSLAELPTLSDVDLFIHDSDHSAEHERRELEAIEPVLSERALVLSDNSHVTNELPKFASRTGREFLFFAERPMNHWYPGAGIGAAFRPEGPVQTGSRS